MDNKRAVRLQLIILFNCLFILAWTSFLCAGNQKPLEEVIAEKVKFRHKNPKTPIFLRAITDQYDANSVVTQAIQLTKDPNELTKKFGYALLGSVGYKHDAPHIRKPIVQTFVGGLKDKGMSRSCAKSLMKYRKRDFSKEAKAGLKQHFEEVMSTGSHSHHVKNVILLIGVADMQTEMDRLQAIIDQIYGPLRFKAKSKQWIGGALAALKARARMGDKDAIQRYISLVDSESDEEYKVTALVKNIGYIRQPEVVEYIKHFLYSDVVPPRRSLDTVVTPYSHRAAAYLEKMIVGFPTVQKARKAYHNKQSTDLEFSKKRVKFTNYYPEYCRQWLEAQTSIEIIR